MSNTTSYDSSGSIERTHPARDFGLWSAFALVFSDVSPIVGIYSVFAIGIVAAGPAFAWSLPLVLLGQLLVASVFGELVSKWPLQGSVYAWSRELVGPRYAWFTNWAYMWALTLSVAFLSLAAANYLISALGIDSPSNTVTIGSALAVLAFGTMSNFMGGRLLKSLLTITLACELIASLGIGLTLIVFYRINPFSALLTTQGTGTGLGWVAGSFSASIAYAGYSLCGFEAAGSIAEEVKESRRIVPKVTLLALAAVGALVIFACFGIVVAIPNYADVMSGKIADPVSDTLISNLGPGIGRLLLVVLAIGFTASMIAVQTAVSRAIWAAARDRTIPASTVLDRLSGVENLPRRAILVSAGIAAALLCVSTSKLYLLLLSFANVGNFISYGMPVCALAWRRYRGEWVPGPWTIGKASGLVTYCAGAWLIVETINIAWPRPVSDAWYLNWGVVITTVVLGLAGLAVVAATRPQDRHHATIE